MVPQAGGPTGRRGPQRAGAAGFRSRAACHGQPPCHAAPRPLHRGAALSQTRRRPPRRGATANDCTARYLAPIPVLLLAIVPGALPNQVVTLDVSAIKAMAHIHPPSPPNPHPPGTPTHPGRRRHTRRECHRGDGPHEREAHQRSGGGRQRGQDHWWVEGQAGGGGGGGSGRGKGGSTHHCAPDNLSASRHGCCPATAPGVGRPTPLLDPAQPHL
jgi:hypothetical protein